MSWLDIADIPWDGGDICLQHQNHVKNIMASKEKLTFATQRNLLLREFFGDDASNLFWETLVELGVIPGPKGARIEIAGFDG